MTCYPVRVSGDLYKGMAAATFPAVILWCLILSPLAFLRPHIIHEVEQVAHMAHVLVHEAKEILLDRASAD